MNELEIRELFEKGYNCGQVVLAYYANEVNLDKETALKISSGLGGGMFSGDSCGAVVGAVMAIGLKYGHYEDTNLEERKNLCTTKTLELRHKFSEKFGSCMCKELLGYDISIPQEMKKAFESGKLEDFCPSLVKGSIDILNDIL